MSLLLIVDIGNFGTRVAYEHEGEMVVDTFSSITHLYKKLEDQKEMLDIKFGGGHYLTGEGVENFYDGKENRMYLGRTRKGHAEGAVRLLHALYRTYKKTNENTFNILLLSPFSSMEKDKDFFKQHFTDNNSYSINGKPFNFSVNHIGTVAEGLGAYSFAKKKNCVLLDAGSGTENIITITNGSVQLDDTHTLNGGTIGNSPFELANEFQRLMKNVDDTTEIVVTGGKARELSESLDMLGYENVTLPEIEEDKFYLTNLIGSYKMFYEKLKNEWND